MRNLINTSKTHILAASALMIFAGFMAHTPALAQGIVPGSTTSAPRAAQAATAKGIKDKGVSGCGNCGITSGTWKSEGGKTQGKVRNAR